MNDEQRNLAHSARQVQNLQLMLLAGMILGAIAGLVVGAYVVLPATGNYLLALLSIVVGGFIGQRLVLGVIAR